MLNATPYYEKTMKVFGTYAFQAPSLNEIRADVLYLSKGIVSLLGMLSKKKFRAFRHTFSCQIS